MTNTVNYRKQDHIITQQSELEQAFLAEYKNGSYSHQKPFVKLNPYGLNPLAALVMFETETPVTVTVTVKGKAAAGDISHTFAAATSHALPVLGLYPAYENRVEVFISTGETHTFSIATEPMREDVKPVKSIKASPEQMDGKLVFITPTATDSCLHALDYAGDCRWILTETFAFDMRKFENGRMFLGSNRLIHPRYHMSGICEVNMLGKMFAEYRMPGCYHHDHLEMEDGNILTLTQDFKTETVEDLAVLLDRETGDVIKTWDFKDVLPQDVAQSVHYYAKDWFHCNAIDYDKKNHAIILSGRHQDAIVCLDYETGALKWILGDPEGWPQEMVDKYFFTPVGDVENFDWQYEQHDCRITEEGYITCFDNGSGRSKNPEKRLLNRDNFSRGVVYKIDTDNMTIEQLFQYGKEEGGNFFSPYICNMETYRDGHYLVHSGGMAFENGIASEKMGSRLDLSDPANERLSRTVEIKDGEVVYDMIIPGQYYRAKKMELYGEREAAEFGAGKVLGDMDYTVKMDVEVPAEDTTEPVPADCGIAVIEEDDRLEFKGKFEKGTLALLILQQGEEVHQYYINTAKEAVKALCVALFEDTDDRWVRLSVNKRGLEGTYAVKLLIEDKRYDTGVTITA